MNSLFYFLVLAAACGIAGAPRNALGFEFAQGVIVDALDSIVYTMGPEGRTDAANLSTGEVIATSTLAVKPLLLYISVKTCASNSAQVRDGLRSFDEVQRRHHAQNDEGLPDQPSEERGMAVADHSAKPGLQ
jgi:hypothetical protein